MFVAQFIACAHFSIIKYIDSYTRQGIIQSKRETSSYYEGEGWWGSFEGDTLFVYT